MLVITEEDLAVLGAHEGLPELCLVPIIMPARERRAGPRGPELLFAGGFRHSPNVDGVNWFAQEIWPAVRSEVPDARLRIVGSHAPPEVLGLGEIDGIEVAGYVPEIGPCLDRAAVSVRRSAPAPG